MADVTTISAKEAVEAVLSDRAMSEAGFLEKLVLDPGAVIRPVIAETIQDDGEIDLSGASISAHIETDQNLHFVITLESGGDEVSGFARGVGDIGLAGSFKAVRIAPSTKGGVRGAGGAHTEAYLCTASGVCLCTGTPCT